MKILSKKDLCVRRYSFDVWIYYKGLEIAVVKLAHTDDNGTLFMVDTYKLGRYSAPLDFLPEVKQIRNMCEAVYWRNII